MKIYYAEDGIRKEAKGEVLAQIEADLEDYKQRQINELAEAQAKATAKAELLARLGITAEEAQLLLS